MIFYCFFIADLLVMKKADLATINITESISTIHAPAGTFRK